MALNLTEILEDLISHDYEEDWFEFKENWYEPHALGEYISGMSNAAAMAGQEYAFFVWGVQNDSHEVVGTTFDFHRDVRNEPLEHYLARQMKPDIAFSFKETYFHNERVVILIIPAAKDVPTAFDRIRYFRIGSGKVNLMDYPERENLNRRTFKKNLGLMTSDGRYNVMAQLLSDNSQIPIRFGLFKGKSKASSMYAVREFGNDCLLYSLDGILRYGEVLNVPQADERERIVERKEVPLFNQKAYREAVINAFVHNHWLEGAPAFTVFQDRIEILSKGLLPPKQTMDGFFAGESVPVNEKLARIILQLHISEQTGRGVPAIVETYGKEVFRFSENNIRVTIPFKRLEKAADAPVNKGNTPVDAPVDAPVNVPVNAPVNVPVNAPVGKGYTPVILI